MQFWKLYKVPLGLALTSFLVYWLFAYDLVRTEYVKLCALYSLLWIIFYFLIKSCKDNFKFLTIIAFISRAIFILAIPNLSQDFYRFIWDGRMILEGFNPYVFTPESFITSERHPIPQAQELYEGMGLLNGSHFTNYPPLNQLCFLIAALFSSQNLLGAVIILRLIIIAADFGTLVFGQRLLKLLNLSEANIFWYILNPFIIIELTGNLHFEGVMTFFLVWSLYLLQLKKWTVSAFIFALSISVKLIPLLFLPLFFKYFKTANRSISSSLEKYRIDFKKLFLFYAIIGITTILLFMPFFNVQFMNNYAETVALWFNSFEFNASIYYIARAIGYGFRGYNEIAIIGKILPILVFIFVISLAFFKKATNLQLLIKHMFMAFTVYLFLSTTVHPWYLTTLLILSLYTNYKFPTVWTFIIVLSYLAYLNINKADKSENLWLIGVEYTVVFGVLIWDLIKSKKPANAAG